MLRVFKNSFAPEEKNIQIYERKTFAKRGEGFEIKLLKRIRKVEKFWYDEGSIGYLEVDGLSLKQYGIHISNSTSIFTWLLGNI